MDWISKTLGIPLTHPSPQHEAARRPSFGVFGNTGLSTVKPKTSSKFGLDKSSSSLHGLGNNYNLDDQSISKNIRALIKKFLSDLNGKSDAEKMALFIEWLPKFCKRCGDSSIKDFSDGILEMKIFVNLLCTRLETLQKELLVAPNNEKFEQRIARQQKLIMMLGNSNGFWCVLRGLEIITGSDNEQIHKILEARGVVSCCLTVLNEVCSLAELDHLPNMDIRDIKSSTRALGSLIQLGLRRDKIEGKDQQVLHLINIIAYQREGFPIAKIWSQCITQILMNYFGTRQFDGVMMSKLKESGNISILLQTAKSSAGSKTQIYHSRLKLEIIVSMLKNSISRSDILWKEYLSHSGDDTFREYFEQLVICLSDSEGVPHVSDEDIIDSIALLEELLFLETGDELLKIDLSAIAEDPFQKPGYKIQPGDGPIILNSRALKIYLDICIKPSVSNDSDMSPRKKSTLPPSTPKKQATPLLLYKTSLGRVQRALLFSLKEIIQANNQNYFSVDRISFLGEVIQRLDFLADEVQEIIFDIIRFILGDLEYVAYKELSTLFSHLYGQSSARTLSAVCDFCIDLLRKMDYLYHKMFVDVGILNPFAAILCKLTGLVKPSEALINCFPSLMRLLSSLLDSPKNRKVFKNAHKGALYEALKYPILRPGVLDVIEKSLYGALSNTENISIDLEEDRYWEISRLVNVLQFNPGKLLGMKISILTCIRNSISLTAEGTTRDVFREAGGFMAILGCFLSLEDGSKEASDTSMPIGSAIAGLPTGIHGMLNIEPDPDFQLKIRFIEELFLTLTCTIKDNILNRIFVQENQIAKTIGTALHKNNLLQDPSYYPKVFAMLLSVCVESPQFSRAFDGFEDTMPQSETASKKPSNPKLQIKISVHASSGFFFKMIEENEPKIFNVSFLITACAILVSLTPSPQAHSFVVEFLECIYRLINFRSSHKVVLNQSSFPGIIYGWLFSEPYVWFLNASSLKIQDGVGGTSHPQLADCVGACQHAISTIAKSLIEVGIISDNLRFILKRAQIDQEAVSAETSTEKTEKYILMLDLLHYGLQSNRSPAYFHFESASSEYAPVLSAGGTSQKMTVTSHPCLLFEESKEKYFPPTHGYSLLLWIRVESFDHQNSITIFGITSGDEGGKVRLSLSVEKGSRKLRFETFKTILLFQNLTLERNHWYHIAIVHQKPKLTNSTVELFVNGTLHETVKCGYLGPPGSIKQFQPYFGCPDRGSNLGKYSWDLGSSIFLEEILLDSASIKTIFKLGPSHFSNWQETLRKYNSEDNLFLDNNTNKLDAGLLSPFSNILALPGAASMLGISDESSFMANLLNQVKASATGNGGSNIGDIVSVAEDKILFSLNAKNAVENLLADYDGELTMSLKLQQVPLRKSVVNISNPKFIHNSGSLIKIIGDVLVACPGKLMQAIWELGGFKIFLKLIENCQTEHSLTKSLGIFIETMQMNWHGTGDVDKLQLYEILSVLLSQKRKILTPDGLDILSTLVGFNLEAPKVSKVSNMTAFKLIIFNFELWKVKRLQNHLLTMLTAIFVSGIHCELNLRRLNKIGTARRLLILLENQIIAKENVEIFINIFRAVAIHHFNGDSAQAIIGYAVSCVPIPDAELPKQTPTVIISDNEFSSFKKNVSEMDDGNQSNQPPISSITILGELPKATQYETMCRQGILSTLLDALKSEKHALCFVKSVTFRWAFPFTAYLIDPMTVIITLKIMGRLWAHHASAYTMNLKEVCLGLRKRIASFRKVLGIYPVLLAIVCGQDPGAMPELKTFDYPNLLAVLRPTTSSVSIQYCSLDFMQLLLFLMKETLSEIQAHAMSPEDVAVILPAYSVILEVIIKLQATNEELKLLLGSQEVMDNFSSLSFMLTFPHDTLSFQSEVKNIEEELLLKQSEFKSSANASHPLSGRVMSQMLTITPENVLPPSENWDSLIGGTYLEFTDIYNQFPESKKGLEVFNTCVLRYLELAVFDSLLSEKGYLQQEQAISYALPSIKSAQHFYSSMMLLNMSKRLFFILKQRKRYLTDQRALANIQHFLQIFLDCISSDEFTMNSSIFLDLVGNIIDLIQSTDDSKLANDNPNGPGSQTTKISGIITILNRSILRFLDANDPEDLAVVLRKMIFYQRAIFGASNTDQEFFRSLIYHLLGAISQSERDDVKGLAMNIWKLVALQKSDFLMALFRQLPFKDKDQQPTMQKRREFVEASVTGLIDDLLSDPNQFYQKMSLSGENPDVGNFLKEMCSASWSSFLRSESHAGKECITSRLIKRLSKLKRAQRVINQSEMIYGKFVMKANIWETETTYKHLAGLAKFNLDYESFIEFIKIEWDRGTKEFYRERGLWCKEPSSVIKRWKLDFNEARSRIRKKLREDESDQIEYLSKEEKISRAKAIADERKQSVVDDTHGYSTPSSATYLSARKSTVSMQKFKALQGRRPSLQVDSNLNGAKVLDDGYAEPIIAEEDEEADIEGDEYDRENNSNNQDLGKQKSNQATGSGFDLLNERNDSDVEEMADWGKVEQNDESKVYQIQRLLDPGDVVVESFNSARVLGLDVVEGLLIISKSNVYIVDNYFRKEDGEIIDIDGASPEERNVFHSIIRGQASNFDNGDEDMGKNEFSCRKWPSSDIKEIYKRLFLFRQVALEIFLADGRNFLLTFLNTKTRDSAYSILIGKTNATLNDEESVAGVSGAANNSVFKNVFGGGALAELTTKWMARDISNFSYLMHLNTFAGRTYNDLTQYPIFPWIIADYDSEELDLNNPESYRDLSKPMGAQGSKRAQRFQERFQSWEDPTQPPCHYGTHYSSAMIVCAFLIRLEPFTKEYLKLQGGNFDIADRLFGSIKYSWKSASEINSNDVRELVPEFFYLPEFLQNLNNFNFGTKQNGEVVNEVTLPPWAKGDPKLFVSIHREALESDYVSAHLHEWIDLIFGFKQSGEEGEKALNIYHYLSYEGAVNIDSITDETERQATVGIIHNFGQTPKQLFRRPHPKRMPAANSAVKFLFNPARLIQTALPLKTFSNHPISEIQISNERIIAVSTSKCLNPPNFNKLMDWDYLDGTIRLIQVDSNRQLGVFESTQFGHFTCMKFADHHTLITGGSDMTVCIWKLTHAKKYDLNLTCCLRGHTQKILCIDVSKAYSIIVSGSKDSTAIIWDLGRKSYVRTLPKHESAVIAVNVNENTGDILTCTSSTIRLWTINGSLIAEHTVGSANIDPIFSCAFYEAKGNEVFENEFVFTGHKRGSVKIWKRIYNSNNDVVDAANRIPWKLVQIKSLEQQLSPSTITCIFVHSSQKYIATGDAMGRVYGWMMPDGSGTDIHMSSTEICVGCNNKFSVLERRTNCRSCGGMFCQNCMDPAAINLVTSNVQSTSGITTPPSERAIKQCQSCFAKTKASLVQPLLFS